MSATATSPYLNRPCRTQEQAAADKALNRARQAISMLAVLGRDDHLAEVEKAVREARERRTQ